MSLGFGTVVLLFAALPGLVFRRFYYSGEFYKQYSSYKVITGLFWSIVIGIPHLIAAVYIFNNHLIEPSGLLDISADRIKVLAHTIIPAEGHASLASDKVISSLYSGKVLRTVCAFSLLLGIQSWFTGTFSKYVVRTFDLDIRIPYLRYDNLWHYYLRGTFLKFKDFDEDYGKVDALYLDVLVSLSENETRMYSGILTKYELKKDSSELELLVLTKLGRWNEEREFKTIPSNAFIIPYSQVLNMNIRVIRQPPEDHVIIKFLKNLEPIVIFLALFSPYILFPEIVFSSFLNILIGGIIGLVISISLEEMKVMLKQVVLDRGSYSKARFKKYLLSLGLALLGITIIYLFGLILNLIGEILTAIFIHPLLSY